MTLSKLEEIFPQVRSLLPVIVCGLFVSAAGGRGGGRSWTLPLEWAETGRWSRVCQSPGLWSRAAAVCKRFSSWRAPRWPPPASTARSVSHTGSHNPKLVSREEAGGKTGKGEEEEEEEGREKKADLRNRVHQINHRVKKQNNNTNQVIPWKKRKEGLRIFGSRGHFAHEKLVLCWEEMKTPPPKLHALVCCFVLVFFVF